MVLQPEENSLFTSSSIVHRFRIRDALSELVLLTFQYAAATIRPYISLFSEESERGTVQAAMEACISFESYRGMALICEWIDF